jgi:hypothetical protein
MFVGAAPTFALLMLPLPLLLYAVYDVGTVDEP